MNCTRQSALLNYSTMVRLNLLSIWLYAETTHPQFKNYDVTGARVKQLSD